MRKTKGPDIKSEAIRQVARSAYELHKEQQEQKHISSQQAATTVEQSATSLPTVEELAQAPRFGLNARALILQAAGLVSVQSNQGEGFSFTIWLMRWKIADVVTLAATCSA